ncbi:MAG TPA: aminoglycoside phosphotransferase family protein, partial [Gaiellaceae bacterium]|nr:aminoglycoside phosphotransferase family protein [Gaiellaceae bacterium]
GGAVGLELPAGLQWLRAMPGGAAWHDRLPQLASECADQWRLVLGPPFADSNASLVVQAGDAVLKINFPDPETEHEPDALRTWNGDCAVRLLAYDAERRALLLERCLPGTTLWELDDDGAGEVVSGLLPRLWKPPPPGIRSLSNVANRWSEDLPVSWEAAGQPFERALLDTALTALRELAPTQGPLVLSNEDFHAGNVLRSRREPWLAIDPKPIAAEREFTLVAMIRDRKGEVLGGPRPLARLRRRLDRLSADLGLDRERVHRWTIAHTLVWGFEPDGSYHAAHAEIARLLVDA